MKQEHAYPTYLAKSFREQKKTVAPIHTEPKTLGLQWGYKKLLKQITTTNQELI